MPSRLRTLLTATAADIAARAGADAAREAEELCCHVAGVTREHAAAHPELALDAAQCEALERLIARRRDGEPLEHLLGRAAFLRRDFEVTSATLIPRPATETLVEAALGSARALPTDAICMDVGTGSGCIAITLAAETDRQVIATDLSRDALKVAHRNAIAHAVDDRIRFVLDDGIAGSRALLAGGPLFVVANLPYVPSGAIAGLAPEVRREPHTALDGGADGLELYRRLYSQLDEVRGLVSLYAEFLPDQYDAFAALSRDHGFSGISPIRNSADVIIGAVTRRVH